jgi:hypothetical protein
MKKTYTDENRTAEVGPREAIQEAAKRAQDAARRVQKQASRARSAIRRGVVGGGEPSPAEMIRRIEAGPGFFASLTDEQWAAIENAQYDGPEFLGASDAPIRKKP